MIGLVADEGASNRAVYGLCDVAFALVAHKFDAASLVETTEVVGDVLHIQAEDLGDLPSAVRPFVQNYERCELDGMTDGKRWRILRIGIGPGQARPMTTSGRFSRTDDRGR